MRDDEEQEDGDPAKDFEDLCFIILVRATVLKRGSDPDLTNSAGKGEVPVENRCTGIKVKRASGPRSGISESNSDWKSRISESITSRKK